MTNEQALQWFKYKYDRAKDYHDEHWEATEREEYEEYVEALDCAIKALTANAELKEQHVERSEWLPIEYDSYADGNPVWDVWECKKCGHEHNGEEYTLTAYCPNCGAIMI